MADENKHVEAAEYLARTATSPNSLHLERARIEATLAVAYEQRTANLIAITQATGDALDAATRALYEGVEKNEISTKQGEEMLAKLDEKGERVAAMQKVIRERLGVSE